MSRPPKRALLGAALPGASLLGAALLGAALTTGCPTCPDDGELIVVAGDTTRAPGQQVQFSYRWDGATVSSPDRCAGYWSVEGVAGGDSRLGTVDECGLYTAPASIPGPRAVRVTASDFPIGGCHDCCPAASETIRLVPPG